MSYSAATAIRATLALSGKPMRGPQIYEANESAFEHKRDCLREIGNMVKRKELLRGIVMYLDMPKHCYELNPDYKEEPMERVTEGLDGYNKRTVKQMEPNKKFIAKTEIVIPTLAKPTIRDIADKYVGPYATAIKDLEAKMGTHLLQADKCRAAIEALKAL